MIIALDFDDTYTADAVLWHEFIEAAQFNGHRVIMVTCRRDTPVNRKICMVEGIAKHDHFFTSMSPKRWFMEQQRIEVDVWIDDMPESVKEGR